MKGRLTCFHRLGLLALIASAMSGCTIANLIEPLTEQTVVTPTQGIVVVRFVNAGHSSLAYNFLSLSPQNINESAAIKPDLLEAVDTQNDGTAIFASALGAGSYVINSFNARHVIGDAIYSRYAAVGTAFGTFQVKPGQVTDLGTLVYYPKPSGDKFEDVVVRVPQTATGSVLDRHLPFRQYEQDALLTWDEDGFDDDRQALYLSVLQNPVNYETQYETPDGTMLFLAPLGVILERDVAGTWKVDAIDTNLPLFAAVQNAAGDRVVGGSEGTVWLKPAGGQWQDISLAPGDHVDDLEFAPDGRLIALVRQKNAIVIKARSDNGQWDDLNQFVATRGWYKEAPIEGYTPTRPSKAQRMTAAEFNHYGDRHYLKLRTHPPYGSEYTSGTEHAYEYDPDTYVMARIKQPRDVLYQTDAGAVKIALKEPGFWTWSGQPKYYRSDAEQGWVEMDPYVRFCAGKPTVQIYCGATNGSARSLRKELTFVSPPWFENEEVGIAVARAGNLPSVSIVQTQDGGASWIVTDRELPEPYCASIVAEVDDRILLSCRGANGDFYESFDGGVSWTQVREHENF